MRNARERLVVIFTITMLGVLVWVSTGGWV